MSKAGRQVNGPFWWATVGGAYCKQRVADRLYAIWTVRDVSPTSINRGHIIAEYNHVRKVFMPTALSTLLYRISR